MGIQETFHAGEDHWYRFLDKLDQSGIPIYRVIDPIDKIVPSFAVALGLLVIVLGLIILPLVGIGGGTEVVLSFNDTQGEPISQLSVDIAYGDKTQTRTTNSIGKIILQGVPIGSTLSISVDDPQYQPLNESHVIEESNPAFTFNLALRTIPPSPITFQFVDGGNLSLSGKEIHVSVICSSGVPVPQSNYTTLNGILTLTPPEGCGNLIGSVSGNGFLTKDGVLFTSGNTIIQLQGLNTEKGKVKVTVRDQTDDSILENMDVELISSEGISTQTISTNSFGVAIFNDVPTGSYYASVTDPLGNFALTTGDNFNVSANQTISVDVEMGKQIQGTLTISVTDKATNAWIPDATVKLIRKSDNQLLVSKTTLSTSTPITLDVDEKGPFILTASHPTYLSETKELGIVSGNQTIAFALEKLTTQNSGKITVSVKDEDNLPVDNAQVILYSAASGFIVHAINPSITDSNGNAPFQGVPSGTYFARATKYPAGPSDSSVFTTDKSIPAQASIVLKIGQAIVQANVKDADGNPVPFATVEFLTAGSDECTPGKCVIQSDAQGVASKSFKADRKIYVHVTAPTFSAYTSSSYQLYPGKTQPIEVKLPKTILGNLPKINFVDVRDPITGLSAKEMKSGKTYVAVFQLQVPSSLNALEDGLVHVRVGDEAFIENDVLRITSVNAPATVVTKGTSYQPTLGYEEDQQYLTTGDAKWVNLAWNVLDPGVYEITLNVRIGEEAGPLDELPFYYRTWVQDGESYLRDPQDSILGTASSSSQKEDQYAEAYQKIYFNGKSIVCDETFCYSGENILNEDDELLIDGPPYSLSVNKIFTYSFVLTSNGPTIYQFPKLRAFISEDGINPSSELLFSSYTVTRPDGQQLSGSSLSTNEIPAGGEGSGLDMGKLEQFKTIVGEYSFLSKIEGPTHLVVQLINEGDIVFQQVVDISIASNQSLQIDVQPTTASAFVPTTFTVHVKDQEGFDIQNALVSLLKIDPNKSQQFVVKQYTDITGKTTIIAPASLPNTHFVFDAVKGGYASTPVEIVVDENIMVFDPTKMQFSLPNAPNTDQFLPLDMTNQTQQGVILSQAVLTGDFQGLLSNGEMQNYVQQYEGVTHVESLETETIQVKAATSNVVNLVANKALKGDLQLTFKSTSSQQEWVQNVPLNIDIKVIGACDDEAIQLTGTPGSGDVHTTAFDNKSQIPFQIANICQVDGKPFPLKNLKAKIVWKSNPLGNVELSTTDIEGSNQSQEVLKSGSYVTLFEDFKNVEESTYETVMTFTPFPQNIGQTAEFTIFIAGEIGAGSSILTIEEEFDVEIKITNLETCITFDPQPEEQITLESDEEEVEFEVDTSQCGDIPVDIFFCTGANNSNCSGGAPEGRLYLSQYSINNLEGSKTVTIERLGGTLPGSYDLTVDASVPGVSPYRIAALHVKVESGSEYAFDMEKSDFTLYQMNAKDSTTVVNTLVAENVNVKAGVCDWQKVAGRPFGQTLAIAAGAGAAAYFAASSLVGPSVNVSLTILNATVATGPCVPCWVAGAIIALAVILWEVFDDVCDDDQTGMLADYVINLAGTLSQDTVPPDAVDIQMSSNVSTHVKGEWNTQASTVSGKEPTNYVQTVGAVFTNLTGYSDPNPLFGVATLRATEHIHGDPGHANASTECHNSNFGPFFIGPSPAEGSCSPAQNVIRAEKFHVKFKTQDTNQSLPDLEFDSVACVSGSTLGAAGKGALPQVAFNWSWNDVSGIPLYACDAANENAVFCDATQFNIDMMKRVKALDEFLAANNYAFDCPENPGAQPASGTFPNPNPIPGGFIGFTSVGYQFLNEQQVKFTVNVGNQTPTPQNATLTMTLTPETTTTFGGINPTCTATQTVASGGTATIECTAENLTKTQYTVDFGLSSTTTANIAYSSNALVLDVDSYSNFAQGTCADLPKNTAIAGGKPGINRWIDKDDPTFGEYVTDTTITFTPAVPNVQALTDLLHYDAYLIRDGYSADFENDFRDYYSTSFADAPSWFKGGGGLAGFNAFYGSDDVLVFSNKYFQETTLPAAGKFRVDISAFFGEDWKLVDGTGQPVSTIGIDFYHLENPSPNSPFYRLPFNGQVGLQGTTYERVGYGLEYINETVPVKVNDSLVQTFSGEGSTALGKVNVELEDDLRVMNSIPSTRGNILEITAPSGSAEQHVVFTPSLATPVVLKINHGITTQPFSTFYQIAQNGSPVDTGNNLTFWEGAGVCYDFTGVPVFEKFNFSPDRAATSTDKLTSWQYSYALDWSFAHVGGNEYLRTIFYTPAQGNYALISESDTTSFFTSNYATPSTSQVLDGISTLPYNNISLSIDSMQDVFDLVADGKICVADSGSKARFYWNPETLYKQTSQTSISAFTNGLIAGQTCLAAPAQ